LDSHTHVENVEVNTLFNIVVSKASVFRSVVNRNVAGGNTDTPKEATSRTDNNLRTTQDSAVEGCQTANLSSHDIPVRLLELILVVQ
jgi:hypothetical protein